MRWRWLRGGRVLAQFESASDCHGEQQQKSGELEYVLYHQTSPENAVAILESGCMRPGPKGYGGSGIYFAPDPLATTCKANHHGVILECVVQLGRVRHVGKAGDWGSRLRQRLLCYDSVALTFLEGGIEFVVFDPSRVRNIRVHKVLHTSCSSSGISVESSSSSFKIPTAPNPTNHCRCSSSNSSSYTSDAGSSGSSVCDDGNAEQSSSLCNQDILCSHSLGSSADHRGDSCEPQGLDCSASKPQHPPDASIEPQQQPTGVSSHSTDDQQHQQQQGGHHAGFKQDRQGQQQVWQQQALGLLGKQQPAPPADVVVVLLPDLDPPYGSKVQCRCRAVG